VPYDLFVTDQDGNSLHTEWEFAGTYTKLWHAVCDKDRFGEERPELRRWTLFSIRRTTGHTGQVHSEGDYPQKEEA